MEAIKTINKAFGSESRGRSKNAGEEKWFKSVGATLAKRLKSFSPPKGAKKMALGSGI